MSTLDFDISNVEGILFLLFSFLCALIWKYVRPFWRRCLVSQVLLSHTRLSELRKKEILSEKEKSEFVEIVKDSLEI